MNKSILNSILIFITLGVASESMASGSSGGSYSAPIKKIDQNYEFGKSVYNGRIKNSPKIKYCIDTGTEKVKLKRKSVAQYKNRTFQEFAAALYDCNNPDQLAVNIIDREHTPFLLYYLNKRFKLRLTDS